MTAAPPPHPSRRAYQLGCPCDACRKANRDYQRAYEARRRKVIRDYEEANRHLWGGAA